MANVPSAAAIKAQGRPRSVSSKKAVLDATYELLDTTSVRSLTIEAIAQKAGVGKTTIYRWWSSKTAIVIEVFLDLIIPSTPVPNATNAAEAISKHLSLLIKQYRGKVGRIVSEILAEGQSEPDVLAEFRQRFFEDRRAAVRSVLEHSVATGELPADIDLDVAIDMLYGAVNFRLIMGHLPLDARFEQSLAEISARLLRNRERPANNVRRLRRRVVSK